jgi:GAF domain-containing protein
VSSPSPPQPDSHLERYQALLDIGDIIHTCRDLDELFRKLPTCVRRVIDFDGIAVNLFDEQQAMRVTLLETKGPPPVPLNIGVTVPIEGTPAIWVLEHQRVLRLRVADNDPQFWLHHENMRRLGIAVTYTFPLTTTLKRLGVLLIAFAGEVDLPVAELVFMQRVVDQVAMAVENAMHFEQLRAAERAVVRERDRTQLLLEVNNAVVSNLGLSQLINAISWSLQQVIPHDAAFIILCDADVKHIRVQALNLQAPETALFEEGVSIPAEGTPEALAITSRRPVLASPTIDVFRRHGCNQPWIRGLAPVARLR